MGNTAESDGAGRAARVEWLKRNWFFLGLLGVIFTGWLVPEIGGREGVLQWKHSGSVSVFLLFILQGLLLPTESLVRGMMGWRLNTAIQLFIFVAVPAVVVPWLFLLDGRVASEWLMGFMFLAVLPTTVATAVVYTSRADGDAGCAMFNSTLANVLGIVVVPLFLSLYLQGTGGDIPVLAMLGRLAVQILVPLAIGQLFRPLIHEAVFRWRARIGVSASLLVLYLVYIAFCNSVIDGVWRVTALQTLVTVCVVSCLLHVGICALALLFVRLLRLDYEKGVASFFLTTQKTIATGIPMAQSLFGDSFAIGVIILPLMVYHFFQLAFGSYLIGMLKVRRR